MTSMTRREFFQTAAVGTAAAGGALGLSGCMTGRSRGSELKAMTVRGEVPAAQLGATLPHEHILLDFVGADQISRDRYNQDVVFDSVLAKVQQAKDLGCDTLVECTPKWIGRDVILLRRLSRATDLQIITNTGCYGAGRNKFLPRHVFTDSIVQLSGHWITEWFDGIDETGVRPGFIKIGVDAGRLSDIHRKLVRAAARTHLQTGLTIAAHSGDGVAALDELATLREEGVAGNAFIWVHAQNESDEDSQFRAAELGAWVEFDHVSPKDLAKHLAMVQAMKARGFLNHVLVSHDAGWYEVGKPDGGEFRTFDTLFTDFIPALKNGGFTDEEVRQLLVDNPREAFAVRVRAKES
jgi:predicted metal-dependent phosphotriesterase family hydrolase